MGVAPTIMSGEIRGGRRERGRDAVFSRARGELGIALRVPLPYSQSLEWARQVTSAASTALRVPLLGLALGVGSTRDYPATPAASARRHHRLARSEIIFNYMLLRMQEIELLRAKLAKITFPAIFINYALNIIIALRHHLLARSEENFTNKSYDNSEKH